MKPHPTKSKPRKAPSGQYKTASMMAMSELHSIPRKPSPRQPGKGGRVMWMHPSGHQVSSGRDYDGGSERPVLVLPLSPSARERRVETVARLLNKQSDDHAPIWVYMAKARAVLASLGDTPAGEGRGK